MADSKVSGNAAFEAKFQACLDEKGFAPNEHFAKLVNILEEYGMIYVIKIHAKYFLVHKGNRGGLLLSPHNCHKNAEGIRRSGADLSQLNNAYCIELSDDAQLKAEHIEKNKALYRRAAGMIPAVTGRERYVTIGCSHTSQFIKHAHAGGNTPRPKLQIAGSQKISLEYLCGDSAFSTMINEGWEWKVVKACVDERFPKFASIAQRALNTRNSNNSQIGELEACMTLAETSNDAGFQSVADWRQLAVDNIVSLCAPCAHYSTTLLDFVIEFGGGGDAPTIQFMDNVAKQFQANVTLGETFWKSVTYTKFADKVNRYPLTRAALVLVNLTCDKIEDGIARLLSQGDVKTVASLKNKEAVAESESVLVDACFIDKAMRRGGTDFLKPLGQLFVRVGLRLTHSEKKGREAKEYSLDQVKQIFLDDISKIVGSPVSYPKWFEAGPKVPDLMMHSAQSPSASDQPRLMATLEDHQNPEWIIDQKGFKLGSYVCEKGVLSSAENIYVIFNVEAEAITLHQLCSYNAMPKKVKISIEELLVNWSISKSDPPIQMKTPPAPPHSLQQTLTKNKLWAALIEKRMQYADMEAQLTYYRRPDQVRTTCVIEPKKLVLVPAALLSNIYEKSNKAAAVSLGKHDGAEYFVGAPPRSPIQENGDWDASCFLSAYWWVRTTDCKKTANMQYDTVSAGDYIIPVLMNHVEIAPHTQLFVFAKSCKPKPVPLSNAVLEEDPDDEADDADNGKDGHAADQPRAKAKAKASAKAEPKGKAKVQAKAKVRDMPERPMKKAKRK